MPNLNVTMSGASLQALDNATNTFRINSLLPTLLLGATDAFYNSYQQCASGAGTTLALPAATVWFVFVRNLHASQNLTVQLTVAGGVQITAANSPILVPGGMFLYANATEGAGGITAITLIGSGANTPAEVLIAS